MTAPPSSAVIDLVDKVEAGELTSVEAVRSASTADIEAVLHTVVEHGETPVLCAGVGASPGAAVGHVYFDADAALDAIDRGEHVILCAPETTPADEMAMRMSEGILTSKGGLASHAAVVARGWGIPAVCGASSLEIEAHLFRMGDVAVAEGEVVTIDGTSGEVRIGGDLTPRDSAAHGDREAVALEQLLTWADEVVAGRVTVRANADTGADAERAREFGAQGVGLCRTEHMFLGDRLGLVQEAILSDDEAGETAALEALGAAQRSDFAELLEAMDGLPVTVRLLDPPLHEFLPPLLDLQVAEARDQLDDAGRRLLAGARKWCEQNPMIGTRGVRLGIVRSELYRMQTRALLGAIADRVAVGGDPIVEIMIPLVSAASELALVHGWITGEIEEAGEAGLDISVGTMIETPRAALCSGAIAEAADFFSYGTNDLTQMTFGFSRDDVTSTVIGPYIERGLLDADPFGTIDPEGVGRLVQLSITEGREHRPDLKTGVCGEHGGDPASIAFFVDAGVDYVSCSPFRVPVARLAVAQALLARR